MALIYVTGAPGAGKTTLQRELRSRGHESHDIDDLSMGGAFHKATGKLVVMPSARERDPEWFEAHEWRVYTHVVEELKGRAKEVDIFVCGVAATDHSVIHLFDKILYLALDERILKERVVTRVENDYGKNEFELEEIMRRKRHMDVKYAAMDVIKINAMNPACDVADEVLFHARQGRAQEM